MNKTAVVVGISNYPDSTPTLAASVPEALRWESLLGDYGFTVVNHRFDSDATRAQVIADITALVAEAQSGDHIAFVYCGHGTVIEVTDPKGGSHLEEALYLFRGQGKKERASLTSSDISNILLLASLPADVEFTIVADCCYSGGLAPTTDGGQPQYVDLLTSDEK